MFFFRCEAQHTAKHAAAYPVTDHLTGVCPSLGGRILNNVRLWKDGLQVVLHPGLPAVLGRLLLFTPCAGYFECHIVYWKLYCAAHVP